jgi:hypothetical protein
MCMYVVLINSPSAARNIIHSPLISLCPANTPQCKL